MLKNNTANLKADEMTLHFISTLLFLEDENEYISEEMRNAGVINVAPKEIERMKNIIDIFYSNHPIVLECEAKHGKQWIGETLALAFTGNDVPEEGADEDKLCHQANVFGFANNMEYSLNPYKGKDNWVYFEGGF